MELHKREAAYKALAWAVCPASLLLALIGAGVSLISEARDARAQSGNPAALLSNLRGQIQRYGCNLPQYAQSVEGCRSLHARVRALESGGRNMPGTRQPYPPKTSRSDARPAPRPRTRPRSSRGGFFSALFGGRSLWGGSTNTSRPDSYDMSNPDDRAFGLNRSFGTYPSYMRSDGRYRTLCVRTCDGYYWPISFSTTRAGFARDARQCTASCSAPARLFVHRNPGADIEHMVDLQGQPYSTMENTFRYREEYVADCRCKPEPWSDAARQEYDRRAAEAKEQEKVKTAANGINVGAAAGSTGAQYPYPSEPYPVAAFPRPRRWGRPRYRADDPELSGRWWAGSR